MFLGRGCLKCYRLFSVRVKLLKCFRDNFEACLCKLGGFATNRKICRKSSCVSIRTIARIVESI